MDEIPATIRTATEQLDAVTRRWHDAVEPFARQVREIQKVHREFDQLAAPLRELAELNAGPAAAVQRLAKQFDRVAELTRIPGIEMFNVDMFGTEIRVPDFDLPAAIDAFVPNDDRVADLEARVTALETENDCLAGGLALVERKLMGDDPSMH